MHPTDTAHERAVFRYPQYMADRPYAGTRTCPLRPDKWLFATEGPHATSWLAYRGDTVRLRLLPWHPMTDLGMRYLYSIYSGAGTCRVPIDAVQFRYLAARGVRVGFRPTQVQR